MIKGCVRIGCLLFWSFCLVLSVTDAESLLKSLGFWEYCVMLVIVSGSELQSFTVIVQGQ